MKAYHGSNSIFSKFDQGKARIVNDFYGGGVAYFTSDIQVAQSYARTMFRSKGGDMIVYECELNLSKIFDVDDTFTGTNLTMFYDKKSMEDFARGAGLLKAGVDKYNVLARLEGGHMELTGEQVFRGLSKGMVNTAAARHKLMQLGYDGLRYNGGLNMNMARKHSVYLVYRASDIRILKRYRIQQKEPERLVAENVLTIKSIVRGRIS